MDSPSVEFEAPPANPLRPGWSFRPRVSPSTASVLVLGIASGGLALWLTHFAFGPARASDGLEASRPVCDLGRVRQGAAAQARFEIVNRSRAAVRIVRFIQSCRCMDVELSRKRLPPGERAVVDCGWDTRALRGKAGERLVVCYANAEGGSEIRQLVLGIQAEVLPAFTYAPATLEFVAGSPGTRTVRLQPIKGHKGVAIQEANCSHPAFSVVSRRGDRMEIRFAPELWPDDARLFPELTVCTDCETEPTVTVPLRVVSP